MKHLLLAAIAVGLVLVVGTASTRYVVSTAEELTSQTQAIAAALEGGRWEETGDVVAVLVEYWDSIKQPWACVISHVEVDEIDYLVGKIMSQVGKKESPQLFSDVYGLIRRLEQVPDKYRLRLKNVF